MTSSFYDVIVLGSDLAPLCCGALLAKRGFRVLVLGQQVPLPEYSVGHFALPRRPFTFGAQRSPVSQRVMSELGLAQSLRRMAGTGHPTIQVAMQGRRFDLAAEPQRLEREIEREFPEVKRPILEFHRVALEQARTTDRLLERELAWPPESFFERRELQRLSALVPFDRDGRAPDPLAEFPEEHPFRLAIAGISCFGSHGEATGLNQLQQSRLYASRHHAAALDGGLGALQELLIERIRTHSGDVRLDERAQEVIVRRSSASGVRLFGSDETIGGAVVVAGIDVAALLRLCQDREPFEQLFERIGEPRPRYYRYALNIVFDSRGAPEGMGRDVFYVRGKRAPLSGSDLLHVELSRLDADHHLAVVEALLPARAVEEQGGHLNGVRESTLQAASELIPFLDEHLVLLDSPHDGLPPEARRDGTGVKLKPGERRGPRTMRIVHAYPIATALGMCAMPVRTPLRGLLLCNDQVAPWLGVEGQLLAASSAARTVSRADRTKEWMRKRLWTKVEI